MRVVFRCDASLAIGTGHVSRCVTLADCLKNRGVGTLFVTREYDVPTSALIDDRGHEVLVLPTATRQAEDDAPHYARLLDLSWDEDIEQTLALLSGGPRPGWLIVDHYGLESRWHRKVRKGAERILAIDDLADRQLRCDILLDQTYGRAESDYGHLVNSDCTLLLGSRFALIRPEFRLLRDAARKRRERYGGIRQVLVFIGGTDPENLTGRILRALESVETSLHVDVVVGASAPHLDELRLQSDAHPLDVVVSVDVSNMAQRMVEADIAIGAAGVTTWERCCLGLPTVLVSIARNQEAIARNVVSAGAAFFVTREELLDDASIPRVITQLHERPEMLEDAARSCFEIVDGLGCERVASAMEI